jgi:hypothetical protein
MYFKSFITLIENYDKDLKNTLDKIPKQHKEIISKFKFIFQPGNELKGDQEHIGIIDNDKKTITVAAPWNFGREMTVLHEIGHLVWTCLSDDKKQEWKSIVKKTKILKNAQQNAEELFCMAYGATYSYRPPIAYVHQSWEKFIKELTK